MTKKALLFGALACAWAAAASAQFTYQQVLKDPSAEPKTMTAGRCITEGCRIDVHVTKEGDKCVPRADPEVTALTKPALVVWKIQPSGWSFDKSEGIKFKAKNPGDPGNSPEPTVWQVRVSKSALKGEYFAYKIVLVSNSNPALKCIVDPGLITDW